MVPWILIGLIVLELCGICFAFGRGFPHLPVHLQASKFQLSAYNPSGFKIPPKSQTDGISSQSIQSDASNENFISNQGFQYPTRTDTFQVMVTGHVGTDPKEVYLRNNSYVVNFSVKILHQRIIHCSMLSKSIVLCFTFVQLCS